MFNVANPKRLPICLHRVPQSRGPVDQERVARATVPADGPLPSDFRAWLAWFQESNNPRSICLVYVKRQT